MPADVDGAGSSSQKPRALIVTVYGLYARESGGWMSVASIIRLLAQCDVDEPAVRSAIFRLKRRGLLEAEKVDGIAGYGLSDDARAILDEGDRRIFERRRAAPDEGWLLAVFSVPETERDQRHQLRSRLTWLGFGTVAAGVWIAPAHLLDETRHTLQRHRLDVYVELFRGERLGYTDSSPAVARWWDLDRLAGLYDEFLARYAPVAAQYRRRRRVDPARAFGAYVDALTQWRRLPYSDPGLPVRVLPAGWRGFDAERTFLELHERLAGPAHEFAAAVSAV